MQAGQGGAASDVRYPSDARLRNRTSFHLLVKQGDVFPGRQCLVRRRRRDEATNSRAGAVHAGGDAANSATDPAAGSGAPSGGARLGIAVPRRYGGAVRRNRFRRIVREVFRHVRGDLGAYDYLVSPRKHLTEPTVAGIRDDVLSVLHRKPAGKRK